MKDEAPRHWHGHSVLRQVEVEYSDGRVVSEALRFVVVHSSQLAQQQTQAYTAAQAKEAAAVAAHVRHVHAQWFACEADAAAAIAEYEHRGPGRRGRPPPPLAVSCGTLSRCGRHPPHAACTAGTSREDGAAPNGVGLSPRG